MGAFLLFLVQPIIAKQILPWFGGSAAVWATCMVFFQMALLAMAVYVRHLRPGGVLAFQATNRFIGIAAVVAGLASAHGLTEVLIPDEAGSGDGPGYWISSTDQILVTSNQTLLGAKAIREPGKRLAADPRFRVWTDSFNNLLGVLT